MVGNDGFYVLLKGLARPQTQVYKNLLEESESTATFIPPGFQSFVFSDNVENVVLAEMHTPPCYPMVRPAPAPPPAAGVAVARLCRFQTLGPTASHFSESRNI